MRFPTFLVAACLLVATRASAEIIEFPESELSQESVVPVFDNSEAVKKRYVPTTERFELNGFLGSSLNNPWYSSYPLGGKVGYHFDEYHSVGIFGAFFFSNKTSYVSQVQALPNGGGIDYSRAPAPKYLGLVEYEFTPYYGKISITKQSVMNLSTGATIGGGMIGLASDAATDSSFAASLGLAERFFFTRNLGAKADLRALFFQQEDVVARPPVGSTASPKKNVVNLMVTVGVVYLLPSL